MSLWEFNACVDGWTAANCPPAGPEAPSREEFEAVKRRCGG